MANTIGWGKATQNNDNGFGKYQNTIGAASIYAESYGGETAVVGTSAAFSYSASTFTQADADPTPTITGTTGGTFSSDAGVSFIDTSTGQIDLSASTIATHAITYIVDGVQSTQNIGITAAPYSSTRSFSFDGVNDYFDLGNNFNFGNGTTDSPFSISAWINMTSTSGFRILNRYDGSNFEYSFGTGGNNKLQFFIFDTITKYRAIVMTNVLNTGQWYHVAATYNGDVDSNDQFGMSIFVNGTPATVTKTSVGNYEAMPNLSIDAYIGKLNTSYANGKIDEVSIWDSALSSSAVTEIYNNGAPNDLTSLTNASSSNLVAWYKMGE